MQLKFDPDDCKNDLRMYHDVLFSL